MTKTKEEAKYSKLEKVIIAISALIVPLTIGAIIVVVAIEIQVWVLIYSLMGLIVELFWELYPLIVFIFISWCIGAVIIIIAAWLIDDIFKSTTSSNVSKVKEEDNE